jgi:hypothetical protein
VTDSLWLDHQRGLAGDEAAALRVHAELGRRWLAATTVDGPCHECGSTDKPGREQLDVSTFGEPDATVDGRYRCDRCGWTTNVWPRVPAPTTEEA